MARGISRRNSAEDNVPVEDTEPKKSSRSLRKSNTETVEEDDEDEEDLSGVVGSGWGAYDQKKSSSSSFPERYKPTTTEAVLHFVDEAPIAVFSQHWIKRTGKMSWTCVGKERCPLCGTGDKPSDQSIYNVIDFTDPDYPELKYWQVGNSYGNEIEKWAKTERTKPLNKLDVYFSISHSDNKTGAKKLSMAPIKARDLEEDWGVVQLTEDEIVEFEEEKYDRSIVKIDSIKQLKEIASEITGTED